MKSLFFVLFLSLFYTQSPYCVEIIAHRGKWDAPGSVQNSIASLKKAHEGGFYGSETDIYITPDDKVVVNHDPALWGRVIEETNWADLEMVRLPNGEPLPSFESYLAAHKRAGGRTKLVVEIKPHKNAENDERVVNAGLDLVKKYGLEDKVVYTSFGLKICKMILKRAPKGTTVLYLQGDLSPAQLKKRGISGFNYLAEIVMLKPEWIKQAKKLGLICAVWTVNDEYKLKWFIEHKIDFITTDRPEFLHSLIEENKN